MDGFLILYILVNYSIVTAWANSANFVESDHGCTSRIDFDNVGDNMTLTLYNVTLKMQLMQFCSFESNIKIFECHLSFFHLCSSKSTCSLLLKVVFVA